MKQKLPTRRMREHPDLEQLKRQAKELLRRFAAGEAKAAAEVNHRRRITQCAICMAGRKWGAQYEFFAHRKLGIDAGLSPAILDSVANGRRPENMSSDETIVYEFVMSLLGTGQVPDPRYQAVIDRFGERGVMDLVGAVGYYSLVSMVLNVAQVPLPEGETPPLKPL